ncbi:MAG TPA: GAF domain-containing protein [Solirubrobacterales bacterium]|nr:GAF domain-containing protein [Solirubrobacterales bacterium]
MIDEKDPSRKKGLDQFTKDVLYNVLVSVTAKVLGWAALLLGALLVALVLTGWKVPAWALAAMGFLALLLVYLARRVAGREAHELRPKLKSAEDKLDRHESYGSNLCSVLDTFQKINAKDIEGMTMGGFIERGILAPARDVMRENGHPHDLRMSVLLVADGHFQMVWAAGHNIESQRKIQAWKNAPAEERSFTQNPKATRGFRSMVSIPILMGDKTHGVFNIVTDSEDAFDPADINYLTSLGSIIQLAFGMAVQELDSKAPKVTVPPAKVTRMTIPALPKRRVILPGTAPGGV